MWDAGFSIKDAEMYANMTINVKNVLLERIEESCVNHSWFWRAFQQICWCCQEQWRVYGDDNFSDEFCDVWQNRGRTTRLCMHSLRLGSVSTSHWKVKKHNVLTLGIYPHRSQLNCNAGSCDFAILAPEWEMHCYTCNGWKKTSVLVVFRCLNSFHQQLQLQPKARQARLHRVAEPKYGIHWSTNMVHWIVKTMMGAR